ncbi:hypothetical protein HWV62_16906 [Athelia sp. TMB]|nr:hypothetical protein HWV62_16906 [Athelia sp. TMB]
MFATSVDIRVLGGLQQSHKNQKPDHYVVMKIDGTKFFESEKVLYTPTPHWEHRNIIQFKTSSIIEIGLYRQSSLRVWWHTVAECSGRGIDFVESGVERVLLDKSGKPRLALKFNLAADSHVDFMRVVDSNLSRTARIEGAGSINAIATIGSQLGPVLQKIVPIIDKFTATHPILSAAWIVLSSTYKIAQYQIAQDNAIRVLVETLREMVGAASSVPDLENIEGTTNVIDEIGRTSLEAAKLVHDYFLPSIGKKPSFIARVAKHAPSSMSFRITQCQQQCTELIQKLDRRVAMDARRVSIDTNAIMHDVNARINDESKIHEWIKAADISPSYNAARKKHQFGTGSWFLNGSQFSQWKAQPGSVLWLYGGPGSGKTILCSSAIENIIRCCKSQPISRGYAYFFFDGTRAQPEALTYDTLIRSIITQLSDRSGDKIPDALADMYDACDAGHRQPLETQLENTLARILETFDSTYIVIDSLDECMEKADVLQWIRALTSESSGKLHLMLTSRPEPEIERGLASLSNLQKVLVRDPSTRDDIVIYLTARLQSAEMDKWDESEKNMIQTAFVDGSDGMLRWVALQVDALKECNSKLDLQTHLGSLPRGLDETYARIFQRSKHPDYLRTLLSWLVFCKRPMMVTELAEVLAVDFSGGGLPLYRPERRYKRPADILGICYGLVTEFEGTVQLAHFSVKEYFIEYIASEEISHSLIAQTCLAHLLYFDQPTLLDWENPSSNLRRHVDLPFPLARYAASYWVYHFRLSSAHANCPSIQQLLLNLFKLPSIPSYPLITWIHLHNLDVHDIAEKLPLDASRLYYASLIGSIHAVQHLLNNSADVGRESCDEAALQAASSRGHIKIAKLLLENGVDVNAQGGNYGTALHAASSAGHRGVAQLLLDNGADINVQIGLYGTALQAASAGGHLQVVRLMLEKGADANAEAGKSGAALYIAALFGHLEVAKLLLENGAYANIQGGEYGTALHAASSEGHLKVVEMLLEKGVNADLEGDIYGTALQAASTRNHFEIAKLLLEKGADPNVKGLASETALYIASSQGRLELTTLLLEKGAEVNAQGGSHGTALHAASVAGHLNIAQLLLDKGADANMEAGLYGTALQAASAGGHLELVKVLLERGAKVNVEEGIYGTELQAASSSGHLEVVKLLLERGADANIQGGDYGTALHAASAEGHFGVARLLLDTGVDANIQVGDYGTALQAASMRGHVQVARLLLNEGVDVNGEGGFHGSALKAARAGNHPEIVQLLRERGAIESQ